MITYDYYCDNCGGDRLVERSIYREERDAQRCEVCGTLMVRQMPAPRIKDNNRKDADRFVADMLGIPEKELPSGLKTK